MSSLNCSELLGTCAVNDCSTDSKGSTCNRFNRRINVVAGRQYAVCINYYSGANDGFVLTFKNEAGSVSIIDNTPPTIINALANACGAVSSVRIIFSEAVVCSGILNTSFTMGRPYFYGDQ